MKQFAKFSNFFSNAKVQVQDKMSIYKKKQNKPKYYNQKTRCNKFQAKIYWQQGKYWKQELFEDFFPNKKICQYLEIKGHETPPGKTPFSSF